MHKTDCVGLPEIALKRQQVRVTRKKRRTTVRVAEEKHNAEEIYTRVGHGSSSADPTQPNQIQSMDPIGWIQSMSNSDAHSLIATE